MKRLEASIERACAEIAELSTVPPEVAEMFASWQAKVDHVGDLVRSDEFQAVIRLGEILDAARADPVIAKSKHVREMVEYLLNVAEYRYHELRRGEYDDALREVVNARRRKDAARPRKAVTREQLLEYRAAFIAKHGRDRGWKTSAYAEFNISAKVLKHRLGDD